MKYAPWVAGAAILVFTAAAIAAILVPRGAFRAAHPAQEWGQAAGPGTGAPAPGTGPSRAPGPIIYVIEQVSPIVSRDATLNEALGIEMPPGRFREVLPKGTPVRYARSVIFGTAADDQKEIRVHVLRGRSEKVAEDRSLGWVRVAGLPRGPRGSTRVAVTFQVVDGAIILVAENAATGSALKIEASEAPPGYNR